MTSLIDRPRRRPTSPELGVGRRQASIAATAMLAGYVVVLVIAALTT